MKLTDKINKRLKIAGVVTLYLFGSRAIGTENARSDYDFGVLLDDVKKIEKVENKIQLYTTLYDILTDAISNLEDKIIDIIFLDDEVSLELKANVVRNGKVIFCYDDNRRANFEADIMVRFSNFKPVIQMMDQNILNRP